MGNRTPKQIASRVQKYFKKLRQANLPIPGSSNSRSLRNKIRPQKSSLKLERSSTFFPERNISSDLIMTEDSDDVSELFSPVTSCTSSVIDRKEATLALLKQVRIAKTVSSTTELSRNCNTCHEAVYIGASWDCSDCDTIYCPDCLTTQLLDKTFSHFNHKYIFRWNYTIKASSLRRKIVYFIFFIISFHSIWNISASAPNFSWLKLIWDS